MSYINIPDNYDIDLSNQFTFKVWLNYKNLLYDKSTIYYQGNTSNNNYIKIYINNNYKLCIEFSNLLIFETTNTINNNIWIHICITLSSIEINDNRTLKLYINGILDSTYSVNQIILNNKQELNKNYYLGCSLIDNYITDYFNGNLSDIVFYNNLKNEEDIINYFNTNFDNYFSNNINDNNLIFYLPVLYNDYFNISGIINSDTFNSNTLNINLNSIKNFDISNNIYINNKSIDNSNIILKQNNIIIDNIDSSQIYYVNNQITQNNSGNISTGIIVSLGTGSDIVLTVDNTKNTITQTLVGNNWIPNIYNIVDNNPDPDVIPGKFDININSNYTTNIKKNILSDFNNYRIGEIIVLEDIRNGSGAEFNITIVNNIITNISLINGGNNYINNDILIISKTDIIGTSTNNKSSLDIKIILFEDNIISGNITNISLGNILQETQDSINQINTFSTTIKKGSNIECMINKSITQIQNGINWGNPLDKIVLQDLNPPTKIKTDINIVSSIIDTSFRANSNITYITNDSDIVLDVGNQLIDSKRNTNDKIKLKIITNLIGEIIEITCIRGNNYKEDDEIIINNIPGGNTYDINNNSTGTSLKIRLSINHIIKFAAANFEIEVIDSTHTNTTLFSTSNLLGYLIGSEVILQGGDQNIIVKINCTDINQITTGTNWTPNYYSISDVNSTNFNILVHDTVNLGTYTTETFLRNDSNLTIYNIGDIITLQDIRNGSGAQFQIELFNNIVTNISLINGGNNYKNNDIIIISKINIPGSDIGGTSSQDILINIFDENLISGVIQNNISINNIIQNTLNSNNTITPLNISTTTIKKGTDINLKVNGYYNEISGINWESNKQYTYNHIDGAIFDINVDNTGVAKTNLNFILSPNGINGYQNNKQIIISDQTPITNSNKIKINVLSGIFTTYNTIYYNNIIDYDIGIPNNIYNIDSIIIDNNNSNYNFLKNTIVSQKFIKIYNINYLNGINLILNNDINIYKISDILYGDKYLDNQSNNNNIVYDVSSILNNDTNIRTINYKSYINLISQNHNLSNNDIINISNYTSTNSILYGDKLIKVNSPTEIFYNNIIHIDNSNSDIKIKFNSILDITYDNSTINNWINGIYIYIDPNPPTSLLTNYNIVQNPDNNFTSLTLESDVVESFEYITNSSDITYSGSGINAKFKIIVNNSILTYIYALDGYNYQINDYININVYNNTIFKGTIVLKLIKENLLNNPLQFNINVKTNKPNINLINPQQCTNYQLSHQINIPKNICGVDTSDYITVTISSIPTIDITNTNNTYWSPGIYYYMDKLHDINNTIYEKYIKTKNIYNGISTNYSYDFDGTTNYSLISENISPNLTNTDFTIEFWIKFISSTLGNYNCIFNQGLWNFDGQSISILQFNDKLQFDFTNAYSTIDISTYYNSWTHIAITYNSQNFERFIYINGNKFDSSSFIDHGGTHINQPTTASGLITIGKINNETNNYFNGSLKKLKIWNIIRNTHQIQESCYHNLSFNTDIINNNDNDIYYLDTISYIIKPNLLIYIPFNSFDHNIYSYFIHNYYTSPALIKLDIDNSNDITLTLNNFSSTNYNINDEISISSPSQIILTQNNNIKKATITFTSNHYLTTNDFIYLYNYYNPNIKNDYLLIEDNLPYQITVENSNTISFNLNNFVSNNLNEGTYKYYQVFKTLDNNLYFNNNIITNFIQDSNYNHNILNYSFNNPGNEILKIRSNGIIQLVTNQENYNTNINNNDKGTQIHLLSNNKNSQIYLQSKESNNYDSIKLSSDNGGIYIKSNININTSSDIFNLNTSSFYLNTNTNSNDNISIINYKGINNSILLNSRFGDINLTALENDSIILNSGKISLKSKGDLITLNLNQNIIAYKYDIITQLNNNLKAIVYENTTNNIIKVKILINQQEFSTSNNDFIILNGILTNNYINSINDCGLQDAILLETSNNTNYTKNHDIITLKNNMGNNSSIISSINPYTNNSTNLPDNNRNLSAIRISSLKGSILLDTKQQNYIDLKGGNIAISSITDNIDSLSIFTNSLGTNETINITNFSGTLDNNNNLFPNSSAIQIISKNGGTKLEVHKNKQLLIQTKHFDENGNHALETTGNHGYLNLVAKGLSDVGPNVPFNINSSGGINITSAQRISIHTSNNDPNNSMIINSLGGINFKSKYNTNIQSHNQFNLISNSTNDVGPNVSFNITSSGGINITSSQKTSIHSSNTNNYNSLLLHSNGGTQIISDKRMLIVSHNTNIDALEIHSDGGIKLNAPDVSLPSINITSTQQALINGEGALKVQGGIFVAKDLIVKQNITVVGNFTVLGNKTQINTDTLIVDDPLIVVGSNNTHSDNYYGGIAIKHSNGYITINNYNNKLYIDSNIITITNGNYNINQLVNQLQNDINNLLSNFSLSIDLQNIITITHINPFTLYYQDNNLNYKNNILSTIGFYNTKTGSNSYSSNKISLYKFSGLVRKPNNNRFYLLKDQKDIITTSANIDTSNPDFTLKNTTDLIKTDLEISKLILNDGSINTNTIPSEGTIQYNLNQGFNSLNAFIKEYPTNILKNISLTQYHYFSTQFYFNQLTNNLQWGNRVSGLIDSNIAIFSKKTLNRFSWVGNQNIYIQHIEINVDEFNNNTDRFYQLRIVTQHAIDNLDINDNTGVLITTDSTINNPIQINGTINKKEINVIPINSQLLQYNSHSNNLINNNCLQIIGGLDSFIGLQLRSIINSNSNTNEVIITLRGFTSFY